MDLRAEIWSRISATLSPSYSTAARWRDTAEHSSENWRYLLHKNPIEKGKKMTQIQHNPLKNKDNCVFLSVEWDE